MAKDYTGLAVGDKRSGVGEYAALVDEVHAIARKGLCHQKPSSTSTSARRYGRYGSMYASRFCKSRWNVGLSISLQ